MKKKYEKIDLKFISKERNKITGKNQIYNNGAQAGTSYIIQQILSKLYYTSYIIKVKNTSYIIQVILYTIKVAL